MSKIVPEGDMMCLSDEPLGFIEAFKRFNCTHLGDHHTGEAVYVADILDELTYSNSEIYVPYFINSNHDWADKYDLILMVHPVEGEEELMNVLYLLREKKTDENK